MTTVPLTSMSNKELLRLTDNTQDATPLARELARRLDEVMTEIWLINPKDNHEQRLHADNRSLDLFQGS